MKVLVVGSGGREHALAWAIHKSPGVEKVWIAPGNPGTKACGVNVPIDPMDFEAIYDLCRNEAIDLVVVGPENPLAAGIADFLMDRGIRVFGPTSAGARLEASKSAAKDFMARHGIPHARYKAFEQVEDAVSYIRSVPGPWVIKADGLAYGKGVTIVSDMDEAKKAIGEMLSGKLHGEAGRRIVIEEFLEGTEATAMALCDGNTIFPLPMAKDHKRVFEGDKGPMTGGMGVFSPLPFVTPELEDAICRDILYKTLMGLKTDGIDYRGVIYAGLMLTEDGPKVLEYNVRFGDPEAQCVLPRLTGDFAGALLACAERRLESFVEGKGIGVRDEAAVTVVMTSQGYPGDYPKGLPIAGLERFADGIGPGDVSPDVLVFQAGTKLDHEGRLVTSGGRVLAVTALMPALDAARSKAYEAVSQISFAGAYYRKDIGEVNA
ncbi:MAG: phosphoribosylamine--glycine ligase [Bacillota bacterium]